MIKLVEPNKQMADLALDYIAEFFEYNSEIHGVSQLTEFVKNNNVLEWFDKIANHGEGFLAEGYVPADTYFAFDDEVDGKIIGCVNIRHILDEADLFDEFGELSGASHIGYSVRPLMRKKGYATQILKLALEKSKGLGLKRVLLICDKTNVASQKTIEKCGGIFHSERVIREGKIDLNYWFCL